MGKEPDGGDLLVGESWFAVIAQALITSRGRSIVDVTDEEVDFDQ